MAETEQKVSLSERLKNYQENAKGGANDRRASENITSPRKLPSNTIAVDSGSEETGSVKRPESASDNSTKQAFSLAKEAFASPTAPRRRSTTSKKAAAPADTEVKKGAVLKSKELLGSNASSATKDAISERPADINEAVTKDAFGKAKDAFTSPSSNPKSLTTSSEKPADISEVATKDVFSKAKNVFAAPSAAITTAAFSEKPADIGEVATKDVFYKAKSAFAGGQTDTHVEQGQQQQPISRRVSIRDNEKVSVRDRVNNYPLGREANESNPESPVPAPRRKQSFSSFKQALGELKHVDSEAAPMDYVPPRKSSTSAGPASPATAGPMSPATASSSKNLTDALPTTAKTNEQRLSIVTAAVSNYTSMINSIANASSSGSKSGSTPTVAASGQQSSVPTPRRNSTATEAGEHSPQQQKMPNSRPSSAVFNKEYTGSKEVSEVIRAILNVDPSISWAVFNYERGNLVTETCGNGDFDTFRNSFKDDGVSYGYLRTAIGVERRTKFVFFKWVGENAKPLQRARAFDGTKKALDLIRVIHLELPVSKHSDLVEKTIWDRLTMAAGANYDKEQNTVSQNTKNVTGSDLHSYKLHSKQFFENIEKSGTIKSVIYESKPLAKTTPVNLGVRSSASPVSIRNETNSDYGNRKTFYRDSFISSN